MNIFSIIHWYRRRCAVYCGLY